MERRTFLTKSACATILTAAGAAATTAVPEVQPVVEAKVMGVTVTGSWLLKTPPSCLDQGRDTIYIVDGGNLVCLHGQGKVTDLSGTPDNHGVSSAGDYSAVTTDVMFDEDKLRLFDGMLLPQEIVSTDAFLLSQPSFTKLSSGVRVGTFLAEKGQGQQAYLAFERPDSTAQGVMGSGEQLKESDRRLQVMQQEAKANPNIIHYKVEEATGNSPQLIALLSEWTTEPVTVFGINVKTAITTGSGDRFSTVADVSGQNFNFPGYRALVCAFGLMPDGKTNLPWVITHSKNGFSKVSAAAGRSGTVVAWQNNPDSGQTNPTSSVGAALLLPDKVTILDLQPNIPTNSTVLNHCVAATGGNYIYASLVQTEDGKRDVVLDVWTEAACSRSTQQRVRPDQSDLINPILLHFNIDPHTVNDISIEGVSGSRFALVMRTAENNVYRLELDVASLLYITNAYNQLSQNPAH